jgi:hypothetical protein
MPSRFVLEFVWRGFRLNELQEISRRKPVLKNRTAPETEQAVVDMAIAQPAGGQVRVSEMLKRHGLSISPAGVRCVWQRHDLTSMKRRLKALEAKVAQDGILLIEAQIAALEKGDKEAHGEFEGECPVYCGAQDTFYVGTLKGVGRVYQQTFIDTYAEVGFAKLYDRKTPITADKILNDRVVPFYVVLAHAEDDQERDRGGLPLEPDRTTVPSRIRRMIGSSVSERAFQASQSPFTFRHTRLTVSLLMRCQRRPRVSGAPDVYWSRQDRRRQSAHRPAWFATNKLAAPCSSNRLSCPPRCRAWRAAPRSRPGQRSPLAHLIHQAGRGWPVNLALG